MTDNTLEIIRKITDRNASLTLSMEQDDYYIHCFYFDGTATEYRYDDGLVTRIEGRDIFEKTCTTLEEMETSLRECLVAVTLVEMGA